ncbi:MAG: hypothetical protein WB801_05725 [Candidatus Dormiibacterota bacterium]
MCLLHAEDADCISAYTILHGISGRAMKRWRIRGIDVVLTTKELMVLAVVAVIVGNVVSAEVRSNVEFRAMHASYMRRASSPALIGNSYT